MIKRLVSRLYNSSPKELINMMRARRSVLSGSRLESEKHMEFRSELETLFRRYTLSNLKSGSKEDFTRKVLKAIDTIDAEIEGYTTEELDRQRDLSVKFLWGHDHDFGEFKLEGKSGVRHIDLIAEFSTLFNLDKNCFYGKSVLDVGCWTGGTSLMLAALGSEIHAIEEVRKYAEMTAFLVKSFGLTESVAVSDDSLYDCNDEKYYDRFDVVHFPGVIYHLTDPLLALRILYNSLKRNGIILVETAGIDSADSICRFEGSLVHSGGSRERMNRSGWNWFLPSPSALYRLMAEAGFDDIKTYWYAAKKRLYSYGKKTEWKGICKAGLSVPGIK